MKRAIAAAAVGYAVGVVYGVVGVIKAVDQGSVTIVNGRLTTTK